MRLLHFALMAVATLAISAMIFTMVRPASADCDHRSAASLNKLKIRWRTLTIFTPVEAYNGRQGMALGKYRLGQSIVLGVKNLSTWAHEMIHAADHQLGNLKERGQHWRSETVAELGGATLLSVLGDDTEADLGGCREYVAHYAREAGIEPITACQRVLKRTCDAVALILDTAESLQTGMVTT